MLFFVLGVILIAITALCYYLSCKERFRKIEEILVGSFAICAFISAIYVCILGIIFGCELHSNKIMYEQLEQTYNGLIYKTEVLNEGFADEFGINNNDIVNEITSYNKTVTKYQLANKSLWTNWFVCDEMDDLKLIDYNTINFNRS